jgi:hypothetical protein
VTTGNLWVVLGLGAAVAACGRGEVAPGVAAHASVLPGASAAVGTHPPAPPGAPAGCGHLACGESYFVDAAVQEGCVAAARCQVALKLVATGAFHINAQYPYRFRAEATPGVDFLGTDPAGSTVFSKPSGDWAESDATSGVITVRFTPKVRGSSTISGVFKLSVCSEQNCLIEQPELHVAINAS